MKILNISTLSAIKFLLIFPLLTLFLNWFFGNKNWTNEITVGAALMLVNILLLGWAWRRIFIKKSIALAASVIVIKYAIIGLMIFHLVQRSSFEVLGFILGLTSVILSLLMAAFIDHKKGLS